MSENKVMPAVSGRCFFRHPVFFPPPRGVKIQILTSGGVAVYGEWRDDSNFVGWSPLPPKQVWMIEPPPGWPDPPEPLVEGEPVSWDEYEAVCDQLATLVAEMEALREALGVPLEPHQILHERMMEAARKANPPQARYTTERGAWSGVTTYTCRSCHKSSRSQHWAELHQCEGEDLGGMTGAELSGGGL